MQYGAFWMPKSIKQPGRKGEEAASVAVKNTVAEILSEIEREGDKARLRLLLPVGLYLQAGARITIDGATAYRIPYVWCLTNTCIAADLADPGLLKEMESGKILALEVVDSSVLTVSTSVPLNQFATVRQGVPAQTFEQAIDE